MQKTEFAAVFGVIKIHIEKRNFICLFTQEHLALQVALKRQQAVEDAIAMRLVSNETGKTIDALPPGKIFGMSISEPCNAPSNSNGTENLALVQKTKNRKCSSLDFVHQIACVEIEINAL